jgi:hypothetical protein
MPPLLRDAGAPAAAPMARATSAFPTGGFIGRAMSQSREAVQPVCAKGSGGARSRGAAGPVNGDKGRVEEPESRKQTLPHPKPIEEGARGLVHQLREFLVALWLSPGRRSLALLIIGTVFVICATAAAQVGLNAWNRPFYEAIAARNFPAFLDQLLVFAAIAGGLLVLNVAQAWLREMIKLRSREWLTRDLFAEWVKPGASIRLARAGEVGINPDQRIHEDARRLSELSADLGVGLLQASLLAELPRGPMEHLGRTRHLDLRDQPDDPGLHGVVCPSLRSERFVARLAGWPPPRRHEFAALSAGI